MGHVVTGSMVEEYLRLYHWDVERAFTYYMEDREIVLREHEADEARGGAVLFGAAAAAASSSDEEGEEDSSDPSNSADPSDLEATESEEEEEGENSQSEQGEASNTRNSGPPLNATLRPRLIVRYRPIRDSTIPVNRNTEKERRYTALDFRIHVQNSTQNTATLSPSMAVLLLHLSGWDIDKAKEKFHGVNHSRRLLARTFDRMRLPIDDEQEEEKAKGKGKAKAKAKAKGKDKEKEKEKKQAAARTKMAQDERLAEFITITSRSDWYSLRLCLERFKWDLVAAVNHWFVQGVRPFTKQPVVHGNKVDGNRVDYNLAPLVKPLVEVCRATPVGEGGWLPEPDLFDPTEDDGNSSSGEDDEQHLIPQEDRQRINGFLIDDNRDTAKKHCADPNKFLLEYISKGKYWTNRFKKETTFKWPQMTDKGSKKTSKKLVSFDWKNPKHVDFLNTWRRQAISRATGLKAREPAQQWSQEELDFLYALSEELLDEKMADNPGMSRDELLPMTVSAEKKIEWMDRINAEFTDTMPQGATKLRTDRKAPAIMTQRARTQAIVDDFKVKGDKVWFAKQKAATKEATKAGPSGTKRKRTEDSPEVTAGPSRTKRTRRAEPSSAEDPDAEYSEAQPEEEDEEEEEEEEEEDEEMDQAEETEDDE
jgi:hypothetical protein